MFAVISATIALLSFGYVCQCGLGFAAFKVGPPPMMAHRYHIGTYYFSLKNSVARWGTAHDADVDMYNAFMRRIAQTGQIEPVDELNEIGSHTATATSPVPHQVPVEPKVVETPSLLAPETPIEFFYKGRVTFGNFLTRRSPTSNGLSVRLASGEVVSIDVGQVISCWDVLADVDVPTTRVDWARTAAEAFEILGKLPPRKGDLEGFWRQLLSQRSVDLPVDSLDLGVYLYQERSFKYWVNPRVDASECNVLAPTAAQRYAAALVLHNDDVHFKRRPSILPTTVLTAAETGENTGNTEVVNTDDNSVLHLVEGGYRVLGESLAMHRETELFESFYRERINATASTSQLQLQPPPVCVARQLSALEVFAMSPASMAAPATVKAILKRLAKTQTPNPETVKSVLKALNYKNSVISTSSGSVTAAPMTSSVTPWSPEVIAACHKLCEEAAERRRELTDLKKDGTNKRGSPQSQVSVGRLGSRMDYRSSGAAHPAMCVDSKRAAFLDDAFSLSPETNEIIVHVADVAGILRRHEALQTVAKDRLSSIFLPTGPLHMLPPLVLESLRLSSTAPNEVISVAFQLNLATGEVVNTRVFPAIIGPVFAIDIESADELLARSDLDAAYAMEIDEVGGSLLPNSVDKNNAGNNNGNNGVFGYPKALMRDLLTVKKIMARVIDAQPWVDAQFSRGPAIRDFTLDKRSGAYRQRIVEATTGNRMVNALLSMYSNATATYCAERNVPVPIAWENRDRLDSRRVRRFASQPLRNWLSQLQQKQLRAALKLEMPLSQRDCAQAVSHVNARRKQSSSVDTQRRAAMSESIQLQQSLENLEVKAE